MGVFLKRQRTGEGSFFNTNLRLRFIPFLLSPSLLPSYTHRLPSFRPTTPLPVPGEQREEGPLGVTRLSCAHGRRAGDAKTALPATALFMTDRWAAARGCQGLG